MGDSPLPQPYYLLQFLPNFSQAKVVASSKNCERAPARRSPLEELFALGGSGTGLGKWWNWTALRVVSHMKKQNMEF